MVIYTPSKDKYSQVITSVAIIDKFHQPSDTVRVSHINGTKEPISVPFLRLERE